MRRMASPTVNWVENAARKCSIASDAAIWSMSVSVPITPAAPAATKFLTKLPIVDCVISAVWQAFSTTSGRLLCQ